MNFHLTPTQVLAGLAVLLVLLRVWRASARRTEAVRSSARLLSLSGRVVTGAAALSGVQWLALTYPGAYWLLRVAALVLPALFASYALTKALTVTTVDLSRTRRGGRR